MNQISTAPNLSTAITNTSAIVGAVNSFSDAYPTWEPLVSKIKFVVDIGGKLAQIHPFALMAWSLLSAVPKTIDAQVQRDQNVNTLLDELNDAFEVVVGNRSNEDFEMHCQDPTLVPIVASMLQQAGECCRFIQLYASTPGFWKRAAKNFFLSDTDNLIQNYRDVLRKLKDAFLSRSTALIRIHVLQVASTLDDLEAITLFNGLGYGEGAAFNPEKDYLEGTRARFFDAIHSWVDTNDSPRVLVLFGQAGTGKSAIAHEVSRRFHDNGQLTSSFTFNRSAPPKPHLPIVALAGDLSWRIASFKTLSLQSIRTNPDLLRKTTHCNTLFDRLLVDTFDKLDILGRVIVVFDALDECGMEADRTSLVSILSNRTDELPSNVRIFVTARPERDLESAFSNNPSVQVLRMDDPTLSSSTSSDIHRYIRHCLPSAFSDGDCTRIGNESGTLFQWAAVACHFITHPPPGRTPRRCFDILFDQQANSAQKSLDALYTSVLNTLFPTIAEDADIAHRFQYVLGHVLAASEPLSRTSLAAFRPFSPISTSVPVFVESDEDIDSVIVWMGALLSNVEQTEAPIAPLHTSFRDFLNSKARSGVFFVDNDAAHAQLTYCCLGLMLANLKFNICCLETSHIRNRDIPSLASRLDDHVSHSLLYASRFWHYHLAKTGGSENLIQLLTDLFRSKFLFWLEILSLVDQVYLATAALVSAESWLAKIASGDYLEVNTLSALVNECLKFVRYFSAPIAQSTPHIYISTLPFSPARSQVRASYKPLFPKSLRLSHGLLQQWPALEVEISTDDYVRALAVSPDSQRVAAVADDNGITIWDTTTATITGGPFKLESHIAKPSSVAFSLDGREVMLAFSDGSLYVRNIQTGEQSVVSRDKDLQVMHMPHPVFSPNSDRVLGVFLHDNTMHVQDSATGEFISGPFTGHTGVICSCSFSSDGKRIVSCAGDETIRVWNASTAELAAGPFQSKSFNVAFSPNGQYIASDKADYTFSIRDAATGTVVMNSSSGHERSICSLSFSPDGHRIASASEDCTIRMWDTTTGTCTAVFTGHTLAVDNVVFTPDGHRLVSSSFDRTIRIWDANPIELDAKPSVHSDAIRAIVFSPSGERIASASSDPTVRLWDTSNGQSVAEPLIIGYRVLTRFTKWVIAFSPDGLKIASGMDDGSVCFWDASSGELVGGPWKIHEDYESVYHLSFSPKSLRVVSGSESTSIIVWDAMDGNIVAGPFKMRGFGYETLVTAVSLSPDGHSLASGSFEGNITVWDTRTRMPVLYEPVRELAGYPCSIAFSPDGRRLAAASEDGFISVWDNSTAEHVVDIPGHTDHVLSVAFSPDGCRLASGSRDNTVRIWDPATGELLFGPFKGHRAAVTSVVFSPDGRSLASGSEDHSIRVWDLANAALTGATTLEDSSQGNPTSQTTQSDELVLDEEGWVKTESGELLFWVPSKHRVGLRLGGAVSHIISAHETQLDFTHFVHGDRWAECYAPS
ncbi:hypothetical protein K488DRAFT_41174 [Vararia minispora EC-137]|uniref:Uncharacterized protein n=1 Tax=Vararia minispora EC-137 TaxID=1314806 RepID=A0ACB8QXQ0_9AGAM|nr:hypothetical protein K488DRAFT_41174 [Vararia minispora EC-137]